MDWLIFFGIILLFIIAFSIYLSRQLSDKDKDIIQSQSIFPGSTQNSLPAKKGLRTYDKEEKEDKPSPSLFDQVVEEQEVPKKRQHGLFKDKKDIRKAIIINEILKRKS